EIDLLIYSGSVRNTGSVQSINGPELLVDGKGVAMSAFALQPGTTAPFRLGFVPMTRVVSAGVHTISLKGYDSSTDTEIVYDTVTMEFLPVKEEPPIEPPPVEPPTVETGSIRILSHPTGADILIDDTPTGKKTTAVITTNTGRRKITLLLDRHVQFTTFEEILPGQSFQRTYTLDPIDEPPEPPTPAFSPFAQLLKHFLGEVPGWWKPIDDFARWATDNFGMDFSTITPIRHSLVRIVYMSFMRALNGRFLDALTKTYREVHSSATQNQSIDGMPRKRGVLGHMFGWKV
ncbi:hypothetical protein LCGC14_3094680, partial [marine sediment metagenome]